MKKPMNSWELLKYEQACKDENKPLNGKQLARLKVLARAQDCREMAFLFDCMASKINWESLTDEQASFLSKQLVEGDAL